jgi:hypothetical protein
MDEMLSGATCNAYQGPCLRGRFRTTKRGPGWGGDGLAGGEGSTDGLDLGLTVAAGMIVAKTDQDLRRWGKEAIKMPTNIDRHGVQRLVAEGAQLVEVLPPKTYEDEHLPSAINIPLTQLDRKTTANLDRHRSVIVYCYDNQ